MPHREYQNSVLLGHQYDEVDPSSQIPHYFSTEGEYKYFPIGKEGNYLYNRLGELPLGYDIGHPMSLRGRKYSLGVIPVGDIFMPIGTNTAHYRGNMAVEGGIGMLGAVDAQAYMVEAYKKMKPAKPKGSLTNTLLELRELPGMLRGRLISSPLRTISNVHLAYQFGWKPLLAEITQMIEIQSNAQKYLRQLLRDNMRPIRRRIIVKDEVIENTVNDLNAYWALKPVLSTHFYRYAPKVRDHILFRDTIWANATFVYFLPKGPRDIRYLDRLLLRMKGGVISPSVVYNAVPWTWLADWFVNFGDVLENMESGIADRLVASRFYGMRTRQYTLKRYVTAGFVRRSLEPVDFHGSSVDTTFSKSRVRGDPFGFGTRQESLNPMQLSILGALGISRLR